MWINCGNMRVNLKHNNALDQSDSKESSLHNSVGDTWIKIVSNLNMKPILLIRGLMNIPLFTRKLRK